MELSMERELQRDNRICKVLVQGEPEAVFLLATAREHPQEWESLEQQLAGRENFALVAWPVWDWNGELSPWPAQAVFGKEDFAGNGAATLQWLEEKLLPEVRNRFGNVPVYLCGYSLAGLFSLWGITCTDAFAGAVSCSGSLWYEGWLAYWNEAKVNNGSLIYLSLGTKEEKTRNSRMAAVGDATRAMAEALAQDDRIEASILEWNEGGHFADSGERLAKGIGWILQMLRK